MKLYKKESNKISFIALVLIIIIIVIIYALVINNNRKNQAKNDVIMFANMAIDKFIRDKKSDGSKYYTLNELNNWSIPLCPFTGKKYDVNQSNVLVHYEKGSQGGINVNAHLVCDKHIISYSLLSSYQKPWNSKYNYINISIGK